LSIDYLLIIGYNIKHRKRSKKLKRFLLYHALRCKIQLHHEILSRYIQKTIPLKNLKVLFREKRFSQIQKSTHSRIYKSDLDTTNKTNFLKLKNNQEIKKKERA